MKALHCALALIALLALPATPGVNAGDIAGSFSDSVMAVARIDMNKLRQVPAIERAVNDEFGKLQGFCRQIREWTGVDLDCVDHLWLGVQKANHGMVVMEGVHDIAAIRDSLMAIDHAQNIPKEGVPIAVLLPDEKKPGTFNLGAVLDERVLVVGQPEATEAYIDAYTGNAQGLGEEKRARIASLKDSEFMVHAFILGMKAEDVAKAPFLRGLTHGEVRMDVPGDLQVNVSVGVRKKGLLQPIQKLAQGFFELYAQMDDAGKGNPIKRQLFENAAVRIEGEEVVVLSGIAEDVIDQLLEQKLTGIH
mgnify:CR=1 FL=1